jgi:hypothetical protein
MSKAQDAARRLTASLRRKFEGAVRMLAAGWSLRKVEMVDDTTVRIILDAPRRPER